MAGTEWITAAEAARRLGIKQATLYSYVSRGVLSRRRAGGAAWCWQVRVAPVVVPVVVVVGGGGGAAAVSGGGAGRAGGRAACSMPGRSRSWPAAGGRGARRAWPGW